MYATTCYFPSLVCHSRDPQHTDSLSFVDVHREIPTDSRVFTPNPVRSLDGRPLRFVAVRLSPVFDCCWV